MLTLIRSVESFTGAPSYVATCAADDRGTFQINVKSAMICISAFIKFAKRSDASIIGITNGLVACASHEVQQMSDCMCSNIARIKMLEFVAAENPWIFVASLHPGSSEALPILRADMDRVPAYYTPIDNRECLLLPLCSR